MGETTSDYLVHRLGPPTAVTIGGVGLVVALALQFRARAYSAWIYWLAVVWVSIADTKLLTAPAVGTHGNQIPVDSDAAWHAMQARLRRDRIWYRIVVAFAMLATAALLLVGLFLESEQFHRGGPPTATTPTLVRSP
jgi:hypothetical protein